MPRGLRACAVLVLLGSLAACTSVVRSGLSELDADALVLALDDHAIAATKERARANGGYDVAVPSRQLAAALRIARDRAELQPRQPTFADVYGEASLVPTPSEERARLVQATAGELARTIEALPNVAYARVQLAPPPVASALDAKAASFHASVVVQRRASTPELPTQTLHALVEGAVGPLPEAALSIVQDEVAPVRLPQWERIGPFTVAKADAPRARLALAGLLALHALLAAMLIAVVTRRRARERATRADGAQSS